MDIIIIKLVTDGVYIELKSFDAKFGFWSKTDLHPILIPPCKSCVSFGWVIFFIERMGIKNTCTRNRLVRIIFVNIIQKFHSTWYIPAVQGIIISFIHSVQVFVYLYLRVIGWLITIFIKSLMHTYKHCFVSWIIYFSKHFISHHHHFTDEDVKGQKGWTTYRRS